MNKEQYTEYNDLRRNGVDLQKHNQIRGNGGSETFPHLVAKAGVFHVATNNGYRVSSEVETEHGEIDMVLFGNPDRLTYAVEVETSPTAEVKQDKLERYVKKQSGVDDMALINVTEMPENLHSALGFISTELGLEP